MISSALLLLLPLAQTPPAEAKPMDPAGPMVAAGRRARDAGDLKKARIDFEAALAYRPHDPELLTERLSVAGVGDGRALWAQLLWEAIADERGRGRVPKAAQPFVGRDAETQAVITARAAAFKELVSLARSKGRRNDPDGLAVAWWARRLALELGQIQPGLLASASPEDLDPRHRLANEKDWVEIPRSLEKLWISAAAAGRTSLVIEAARIVVGLAAQAGFTNLKGEAPPESFRANMGGTASNALAQARRKLKGEMGRPWTIDELDEQLATQEEAFTRDHDSFGLPGTAHSPREWYLVETDCGFQTLRGVAATIESHHTRLVNFYGEDPFTNRPGLVRIVPLAAGLESEGAPFYWAAGFQGGDVTTFRFSAGTIEGLGHGLTHELTHRFDGALCPGQPAWLTEGKAVWTGSAYGHSDETEFVPNHVNRGTLTSVYAGGWSRSNKLKELLIPDLEDYRANYSAGYALYVFLNTWVPVIDELDEDGKPLPEDKAEEVPGAAPMFHEQLQSFMSNAGRGAGDRMAQFEGLFCDGRDGRPEDFEGFCRIYGRFLRGFNAYTPAAWTDRYTSQVPGVASSPLIYDEPTWVWSRNRTEPYFGDAQAAEAGMLLDREGKRQDAALAFLWAMQVEGRLGVPEERLVGALEASGAKAGAWAIAQQRAFPLYPVGTERPRALSLKRTMKLLEVLKAAAVAHLEHEWRQSAARFTADHNRLARWLGEPELQDTVPSKEASAWRSVHPVQGEGWVEEELVGHDDPFPTGNWFFAPDGDLGVGRRKAREGTGRFGGSNRGAVFVRGSHYELPGTYLLKTRVRFTTTYANGQLILGWARRDRAVTIGISGAATTIEGNRDEEPKLRHVSWSMAGGFERDGSLQGAQPSGKFKLTQPSSAVEVEVLVDGASATLSINGERLGTYHMTDGTPIEGFIGFSSSAGALRMEHPVVERLDRPRTLLVQGMDSAGLDIATGRTLVFSQLEGRLVAGIPPRTQGSLMLWVPCPRRYDPDEPIDSHTIERRALVVCRSLIKGALHSNMTQEVLIALPAAMGAKDLDRVEALIAAEFAEKLPGQAAAQPTFMRHPFDGLVPEGFEDTPDLGKRWVFFLDAAGVARFARPAYVLGGKFDPDLDHWLRVYRDNGRPPRDLPQPSREEPEDETEDSAEEPDGN